VQNRRARDVVGVAKMMMRGCATTDFVMINDAF